MKATLIFTACAFVALGVFVLPLAASQDDADAKDAIAVEDPVSAEDAGAGEQAVDVSDAAVASQSPVADEETDNGDSQDIETRFVDDSHITPDAVKGLIKRFPGIEVEFVLGEGNRVVMRGRKEAVDTVIKLLRSDLPQTATDAAGVDAHVNELVETYDRALRAQVAAADLRKAGQDEYAQNATASDTHAMEVNALLKATITELLVQQRADALKYHQALAAQQRSEAALNARASTDVSRDELLKLVQSGFTARQELHSLELQRLKERVQALEQRLQQREMQRERIINQRVDAMLKGAVTPVPQELEITVDVVEDSSSKTSAAAGAADSTQLLRAGDTLGVYIPHVLPRQNETPPVFVVGQTGTPATGYPLTIREDGTLSLPLIPPLKVEGMTLTQAEELIRAACTEDDILKAESAIVMLSMIRRAGDSSPIHRLGGDGETRPASTQQQAWQVERPPASLEWDRGSRTATRRNWPHFGDHKIRLSLKSVSWKNAMELLAEELDVSLDYQKLPEGTVTIDTGDISTTAALDLFESRLNAEGFDLQVTSKLITVARRPGSATRVEPVSPWLTTNGPPVIVQAAMEKSPTQYFDALWNAYRSMKLPQPSGDPAPESATQRYQLLLREYSTQLHYLRSNLDVARAEHSHANAEHARGKALHEQGALITDSELRALRTKLAAAEAKVEQAALILELYESAWDEAKAAKEVGTALEPKDSAARSDANSDTKPVAPEEL